MLHMMDDPVVAMVFLLGLVVVLAVGLLTFRSYGARQHAAHVAPPVTAEVGQKPEVGRAPDARRAPELGSDEQ